MAEPIIFTDSAAAKVGALIVEEDNDNLKLRVYISVTIT
jgi:iron-sulfur cluster insertion protein